MGLSSLTRYDRNFDAHKDKAFTVPTLRNLHGNLIHLHPLGPSAQLLSVLSVIHRALVSGSSLTKRYVGDIGAEIRARRRQTKTQKLADNISHPTVTFSDLYYADPALFGSQSVSDGWLAVVQSLFNVPRWRLGVYAAMRGLVVGDLDITISKPVAYGPPPPPPPSFTAQATTRISVAVMAQSTATPSGDLLRRQLALRTGPDVVASRLSATVLAPQRQAPISRTNLSFALGREIPIGVTPRGVRAPKRMVGVPPPTEAPGCASTNEPITYVRTRADFLLLVEKETIFHKLMSLPSRAEHGLGTDTQRQSFAERYNCIVMTVRCTMAEASAVQPIFFKAQDALTPKAPVFSFCFVLGSRLPRGGDAEYGCGGAEREPRHASIRARRRGSSRHRNLRQVRLRLCATGA
jgi:hypothetical protein